MSELWINIQPLMPELLEASFQTMIMLGIGLIAALVIGGPLGILLWWTSKNGLQPNFWIAFILGGTINLIRSFPFIILMIILSPISKVMVGTSIGPVAASIPLSFAAIAYFSRLLEQALREIPKGVIEAARAMGATSFQIIYKVLLCEARSAIVSAFTLLSISFLSYSAVVGAVGGGGIGDFAIRYGYYRYDTSVLFVTVCLLIITVQLIQFIGNMVAKSLDKR
jgi:D-methionine transport system permease protein